MDSVAGVDQFCYLGDMIGAGGGAEEAARTRVRCAWGKFNDLKPLLTKRVVSLKVKGKIYKACVRSVLVYGSETWPIKEDDLKKLERTERAMIRWMCGVSLKDRVNSDELMRRLDMEGVREIVTRGSLRWFGHVERKEEHDWVSRVRSLEVKRVECRGRGRKTWKEFVGQAMKARGLTKEMAQDKELWRRGIHGDRPTRASTERRTLNR